MKTLIKNSIITPDGTELISRHRHDYVTYQDQNGETYMVDGGLSYTRRGGPQDYTENSVFLEDVSEDEAAKIIVWGSYGKDGKSPLTHIPICDMDAEHIEAVLGQCTPSPHIEDAMHRQLKIRKQNETKN